MKKVTLTVPWGQFDPNVKNSTILHVWVSDYFTYNIIICRSNFYSWHWLDNHLLRSSLTKLLHSLQINLVFLFFDLGQMSLNTSKDIRTSLHENSRPLAIMVRSARHRTSQKKELSILHGKYCGVNLSPSGNKHKWKINGKTQKLANVCDIVRRGLR